MLKRITLAALVAVLAVSTASAQYGGTNQNPVFPVVTAPTQNTITPAKEVLGKMLFWDEQMSNDNSMACGTCHIPDVGGVDPRVLGDAAVHPGMDGQFGTTDDRTGSPGVIGAMPQGSHVNDGTFYPAVQVTPRRAPSVLDKMFDEALFLDGRAGETFVDPTTGATVIPTGAALESLSLQPLLNEAEMGCLQRTLQQIVVKLSSSTPMKLATNLTPDMQAALAINPSYADLFNAAFGTPAITAERIAFAMATYMRSLASNQTPFDDFVAGNNGSVFVPFGQTAVGLTAQQQAGFNVYQQRCAACHTMPMFSPTPETVGGNGQGGIFFGTVPSQFAVAGLNDPNEDPGLFLQTFDPADFGKIKIPSLRNVGLREPFGLTRSGRYDTLEAVVEAYAQGGAFTQNISSVVTNLGSEFFPLAPMTAQEKADLVEFIRNGLTDPRAAAGTAPFDRPTLASELNVTPTSIGTGTTGTGNIEPAAVTPQPPAIGTVNYTVGVSGGLGGSVAVLALSTMPAVPGTNFNGVPVYVSTQTQPILVTIGLDGSNAGEGMGSLTFNIPDDLSLQGLNLYGQWFVVDPSANSNLAATSGFEMTLF